MNTPEIIKAATAAVLNVVCPEGYDPEEYEQIHSALTAVLAVLPEKSEVGGELLLEAANELGNTLHKFDTVVESLRLTMKVADPKLDTTAQIKEMTASANPARETLKKLNLFFDSPHNAHKP